MTVMRHFRKMKFIIKSRVAILIIIWSIVELSSLNSAQEFEVELEFANKKDLAQGEHYYEELKLRTGLPTYGLCWQKALADLKNGCQFLTEIIQQKLAYQFAKCFLESSGRSLQKCRSTESRMESCLADLDPVAFSAYQTYFVHTQSICFYLKAELWQDQTKNTITKLSSTSFQVVRQLEDSNRLQKDILRMQSASIDSQNELLEQGHLIGQSLEESRLKVRETFEQFEKTTKEQKDVINRVFDRVVHLQASVFGMFTGVDSFIFYILAYLVSFLATSQQRTNSARIWILVLWTTTIVLENRIKPQQTIEFDGQFTKIGQSWIFYFRCFATIFAVFILLWFYLTYKDYTYLNWKVADDHSKGLLLLNQKLEGLSGRFDQLSYPPGRAMITYPPGAFIDSCKNYDNSDSSDCTFNSTNVGQSSSEDDGFDSKSEESFNTTFSYLENGSSSNVSFAPNGFVNSLDISTLNQSTLTVGRYNLRSRNNIPKTLSNSFSVNESPKSFENLIHTLSRQNRKKRPF